MCQSTIYQCLFSIIIPVYNVEDYISDCLTSCLNQDFEDFEIILVDDCGNDDSMKIAKWYAQQDQRITIINHTKNLGLFHARKTGVQVARGKYCLFVDSDDFLALNTLSTLARQKIPDILAFNYFCIPKTLKSWEHRCSQEELINKDAKKFLCLSNHFETLWGKAIRTELLQKAYQSLDFIQPPLSILEDGIIILALSIQNPIHYRGISQKLYYYRFNPNSLTRSLTQEHLHKKIQDFQKILTILKSLEKLYPQSELIVPYRKKVISAYILTLRYTNSPHSYFKSIPISPSLHKSNIIMQILPPYIQCSVFSYSLFPRWQTLIRIVIYCLSIGMIKL